MMNAAARQPQDRRLTRVADRSCSRPGCSTPAVATLLMRYADQQAVLTDLTIEDNPELYDLCAAHGDRTRPPRGWSLDDERSDDVVVVDRDLPRSVDDTVALLAAALHPKESAEPLSLVPAEPLFDPVPEPALADVLFVQDVDATPDGPEPTPEPEAVPPSVAPALPSEPVRRGWRVPAADRR